MPHRCPKPAATRVSVSRRPASRAIAARPLTLAVHLLAAGGLFMLDAHTQTALAQNAQNTQNAASQPSHGYDIPAGPLGSVLTRYSREAGIYLVGAGSLAEGKTSPGLKGSYSVAAGFAALLAGTGLQAFQQEDGSYGLRPAPPRQNETTLTPVKVSATGLDDSTTEGTGSYTQTGTSGVATGLAMSLRETPQSVSVITRQRMDDFKLESLADVMDQMPGVNVIRQGAAATFQSRGTNLNLSTDGNRQGSVVNAAFYTSSTLYSLDDMAEIDHVEVLKGSAGLTRGDGSYGGTINLVRKKPTREFQASVGTSAGRWDSYRASADVSGPLNEGGSVRGRLVASASDADSFRDFEKTSSQLLYGTLDWDIAPDTLLNLGLSYKHREHKGTGSTTGIGYLPSLGLMPRSFNPGAPWAGYEQDSVSVSATLERRFATGWTAKLQLSHERQENPLMLFGYWSPNGQTIWRHVTKDQYTEVQQAMLEVKGPFQLLGREHELLFGAGASRVEDDGKWYWASNLSASQLGHGYAEGGGVIPRLDGYGFDDNSSDKAITRRRYAYAAGRFSLADPLKLIAGLRVSDYDYSSSSSSMRETGVLTPYAGLVYELTSALSWYGSYASIFNPQTARDANKRTLAPEEGLTYETGVKGEFFNKRLNASVSYFWMQTDNTAESTGEYIPGTTEWAYRGVMGATRRGYELELSGELSPDWQAQGSYVQNDSNLSTANQTPKHQFKLGSSYRLRGGVLNGLAVGAATRWQSAISGTSSSIQVEQKAYWLVDLMARYPLSRQLSLGANVNNLLDKKYFAGITSTGRYTWGAPRSFNVSMRYDF